MTHPIGELLAMSWYRVESDKRLQIGMVIFRSGAWLLSCGKFMVRRLWRIWLAVANIRCIQNIVTSHHADLPGSTTNPAQL